ncbi:DUF5683 domain-containing protein [Balneola sp. MJW-20]|uniref:DUF5683 domain-containing protein n=1 Tax=Gracilimonas aurantiaca TaxID=3234185 RepID=UPI00346686DE
MNRTRKILLLSVLILVPYVVNAQALADLSGKVIKMDEKVFNERPSDHITISDFSYNAASEQVTEGGPLEPFRQKAGLAFISSAILPGTGQAANGKWVRAGIYFAAEVVGIIYHLDANARARRQERAYERFTHENWSVVAYAEWLVNYSAIHNLENGYQALADHISAANPDFSNTINDWRKVDINLLRSVEQLTPYIYQNGRGSNFSHLLPDYGSQQYYELISKYYQYQPGWRDWYGQITTGADQSISRYIYLWNGSDMPFALFYEGRDRAQEFNDNYRTAGNILKLLVVNHVVSAFDAFFTVRIKNTRIETQANLLSPTKPFSVTLHF